MEQPKSKLHWEKQKEEQVKRKTLLWFLWLGLARLGSALLPLFSFWLFDKDLFLDEYLFCCEICQKFHFVVQCKRQCKQNMQNWDCGISTLCWKPFPLWHLALFTVTAFNQMKSKKMKFCKFWPDFFDSNLKLNFFHFRILMMLMKLW